MSEYRNLPLADFFACTPVERVPQSLFDFFAPQFPHNNGVAIRAPYGVRKLEASLLCEFKREDVSVVHPDHVEDFICQDTSIVGVSTMDPLSLGPVSAMFTGAGKLVSHSERAFVRLVENINNVRKKSCFKFKLIVGGAGSWQLVYRRNKIRELGIDHVVVGETEHIVHKLFKDIQEDDPPEIIKISSYPEVDQIPPIVAPSLHGMVEATRGCGRGCKFCEPNLRVARHMPINKIAAETRVNADGGAGSIWVLSEDIFLYGLEDRKNFTPNREALIELFQRIVETPGVMHTYLTHASIAPAAADPNLVKEISRIIKSGPDNIIGIQPGLESGSTELIKKYMPQKAKPFSPDEWFEVVIEGTRVFNENYWFPAYTLIVGMPGETKEDAWDTLRLIDALERKLPEKIGERAHFVIAPLAFVPVGVLRGNEFFELEEQINEASWCVIYRAWRHTLLELERFPWFSKYNPGLSLILRGLGGLGLRAALWNLRRWGRKLGYDVEKAIKIQSN
ncbi:MAG: B12-binding domain-containing radical SAM protein [Thermoproteota archaeon]